VIEPCRQVELSELQPALAEILAARQSPPRRIVRLDREPSAYHSSFPLEELTVWFEDGEPLTLILKNLNPEALSAAARAAKPEFLDDPLREIELYRSALDFGQLGTAVCYGTVVDADAERYWLFLEKVAGRELYQVGEFEIWRQTARWLVQLHSRFAASDCLPPTVAARLIRYDAAYYERWLERAISFRADARECGPSEESQFLRGLASYYPRLVRELTSLPVVLIHGEFYASNVIVQGTPPAVRVCPVDWERAALGPGLVDLAALVAGKWTESQKRDLAMEYFAELGSNGPPQADAPQLEDFLRGLDLCRLQLAVQWLGWSGQWSPPLEHRQDWFAEARCAARGLGWLV
jgi:phosphotransferase family enzyme